MDNCFFENLWTQNKPMRLLYTHGCSYKIMSIVTINHPYGIPPVLKCQIDYFFILKESYLQNRKRIWEHYCGNFITFEGFCSLMDQTTNNYDCLVVNNNAWSNNIEDIFYWYKAKK